MAKNQWVLEGFLGSYPRTGTTEAGRKYYSNTVSTTKGKDDTGKYIKDYIKFTLWGDACDIVEQFGESTYIRVTGKPALDEYTKKDGTYGASLRIDYPSVEIIEAPVPTYKEAVQDDPGSYSGEPF